MLQKIKNFKSESNQHLLYALLIFINNFAFGVCFNLFAATLVDLSVIYGTTLNTMSSVNLAIGTAYMTGSLISFLYKWLNRQLVLSVAILLKATAILLLPYYGQLWLVYVMMFIGSLGAAAWEGASNVWLLEMFSSEGSSAILMANQLMYGIGGISSNLLASSFVFGNQTTFERENRTLTIGDRIHSLAVPFTIGGTVQAIVPILFMVLYFVSPYTKKPTPQVNETFEMKSISEKSDSTKQTPRKAIHYRKCKLALIGASLASYIAAEYGFITFSSSMYQFLDIQLSAEQAAKVMALLSATYTIGRLASTFVALKLANDTLISIHFTIQLASLALLYFGQHSLVCIYIGTATLGYGFSAIFSTFFSFTHEHLILTDRIGSLFAFLSGVSSLLTPLILSQLFNTLPILLMLLAFFFITISFTLFVIVRFWIMADLKR